MSKKLHILSKVYQVNKVNQALMAFCALGNENEKLWDHAFAAFDVLMLDNFSRASSQKCERKKVLSSPAFHSSTKLYS